jgi:type VI protein secretion system component VasK
MGREETALSRDEFEALKSLTNARYVEVATQSWEYWFSALKLNRVDGLLQAADRAVLFGSEDSPITQLLSVLDQHMPLPQTLNLSWYERFKNRIYEDWLNVQFQFGWRTTAAAGLNVNDPRRAIGQHFMVLRRYFSDKTGKSPDRDRLLSNITAIGQYLEQSDAAEQTGVKSSQPGVLKRLQVQASQLPKPLKEMTMALLFNTESELKKQNQELVVAELRGIPSYKSCMSGPRYPLNLKTKQEMLWREFVDDFSAQGRIPKFIADQKIQIESIPSAGNKRLSDANNVLTSQDLRWLERTTRIGKAWFPDRGGEFSFFVKAVGLENSIRMVRIRFDDQSWSYSHGQQYLQKFTWSGNGTVPTIEMEVTDLDGRTSRFQTTGPWGLLHWASQAKQQATNDPNKLLLDFKTELGHLELEVSTLDTLNPLSMKLYENLCS